jgi:hypothetical protein
MSSIFGLIPLNCSTSGSIPKCCIGSHGDGDREIILPLQTSHIHMNILEVIPPMALNICKSVVSKNLGLFVAWVIFKDYCPPHNHLFNVPAWILPILSLGTDKECKIIQVYI